MKPIGRRGILKGLAGSALAAPLAQMFSMHRSRAAAGSVAPVPKVVFFYTPCGVEPDLWHPGQSGSTFTLPKMSAPLAPHQKDCIFVDGVSMYPLNDHQGGSQQMLAGDDKDVMTLDLQLGQFLKTQTPFSSVQLGIQSHISRGGLHTVLHPHFTRISLREEVWSEDNPLAAFGRIFDGFSTSSMPTANAALLAMQKKSILDAEMADLNGLASSLPNSEKQKVVSFTDSIRALELRLSNQGVSSPSCGDPSAFNPTHFAVPQVSDPNQASYNQTENRLVVSDLQLEIARLSLACGRTRVVTIVYDHTNAHNPVPGLGIFGVHDSSHFNAPPGQNAGSATPAQHDAKLTAWENYRVWYAQKLVQFITMLKSTPDTTGTLFDNTMIFHCSELGDGGPHKTDRIPFAFIGGGALGLKLGQSLKLAGSVPAYKGGSHDGIKNVAHSTLLTAIAYKMGMPLQSPIFGFSGAQAVDYRSLGIFA